ncbi:peptidoglycan DD-metalloendopeptidase family protein [Nocardioides bruguierae]|uniref:M23 family metallopeptidase n=1 Tax=Nocardioides bruguierae TaxID=2945102 RepID=A0A9X2D5Z2_9ACTN|nr:peptidoglycan DD-metalloendopeptidase family protein [Nocardioides bruguierae]MCM0619639.1 M23 family metallopeptidase [Nocardioides bruguierae]
MLPRHRARTPALSALAALALVPASTEVVPAGEAVWPVAPASVVHAFEAPSSAWGPGHRGVDLAGTSGQVVRAALAGRVVHAGPIAGRGVVVVSHGATRTTYEPVTPGVRVGDDVAAGDALGTLELLGSHCLPAACLHWGLIEGPVEGQAEGQDGGDVYRDPLTLLGGAPVRLLPLTGLAGASTAVARAAAPTPAPVGRAWTPPVGPGPAPWLP